MPVVHRGDPRTGACPTRRLTQRRVGGLLWTHLGKTGVGSGEGAGAVFEAPALVAGLDDVAMMNEAVEESGGHLGVAEHAWKFTER